MKKILNDFSFQFYAVFTSVKKQTVVSFVLLIHFGYSIGSFYRLLSGAQLSTAGVDLVQEALDALQVGNAVTTTQLQNQLHQGIGGAGGR